VAQEAGQANRDALAAWSRGTSRSAFSGHAPGGPLFGQADPDDTRGVLGLWEDIAAG
jgi:hypothetical protein